MQRIDYEKLSDRRTGEPSETIGARVESARQRQRERFAALKDPGDGGHPADGYQLVSCNADMRPAEIRQFCSLDGTGQLLMRSAMSQLQPTARDYYRVLKLARTIADLAGSESIGPAHLAEAIQYQPRMNPV